MLSLADSAAFAVYNKPFKGHDAFRHALYGDTITVERRISTVGAASSYALKDHAGRCVADSTVLCASGVGCRIVRAERTN